MLNKEKNGSEFLSEFLVAVVISDKHKNADKLLRKNSLGKRKRSSLHLFKSKTQ
jgi:hypothetical protein